MAEEERRKNDLRMCMLERTLYGEQINGNRVVGIFEKTEKMWEQFVFMFRLYKVLMVFISATALGIIAILIKLFMGGAS
jgi:hypothetical protein